MAGLDVKKLLKKYKVMQEMAFENLASSWCGFENHDDLSEP